jgi:hypothetical protein
MEFTRSFNGMYKREEMQITSEADDCRKVKISGLDSYRRYQEEIVELKGTEIVTPKLTYLKMNNPELVDAENKSSGEINIDKPKSMRIRDHIKPKEESEKKKPWFPKVEGTIKDEKPEPKTVLRINDKQNELILKLKDLGDTCERLVAELGFTDLNVCEKPVNKVWLKEGEISLQKALMYLQRAIINPDYF